MMTKGQAGYSHRYEKTGFVDFEDGNVFPVLEDLAVRKVVANPCNHVGTARIGQNLTIDLFKMPTVRAVVRSFSIGSSDHDNLVVLS